MDVPVVGLTAELLSEEVELDWFSNAADQSRGDCSFLIAPLLVTRRTDRLVQLQAIAERIRQAENYHKRMHLIESNFYSYYPPLRN